MGSERSVNGNYKYLAPTTLARTIVAGLVLAITIVGTFVAGNIISAQTRRRSRTTTGPAAQTKAPRTTASKYSAFLHSSEKHKSLKCNECHKAPTDWTAKRAFPDVADFPDHDACVRCHRQQFFTRQAMVGTGPAICTVCHVRAAPREDARFGFGKPNNSNQPAKTKDERQFTIEFPHDQHQNVIAQLRGIHSAAIESHHRLNSVADDKKPDYNNCSICHQTDLSLAIVALAAP